MEEEIIFKEKENLTKNTILLSVGILLTNVLQFFMVPLFSGWLSTSDYGTFDLCITYISLTLPIINLASGEAVFRFSIENSGDKKKEFISNGLSIILINSTIASVLLIAFAFLLQKYILLPFLLLLLGQIFNSYCQSFLRGIKKLNIYSIGNILTTVFIAIFVSLLVWKLKLNLYGIILGYALGYILGDVVILSISKYWRYFDSKLISLKGMTNLIKYSYPLIPNNICWWIINASDRIIINTFMNASANGIYAISNKIPNVCSSVFGMFNISWQESASEVVDNKNKKIFYNQVYNDTIRILISLCTGVLSINFFIFDFIFDNKYSESRLYMPILVVAIIFSSLSQFYGGIMISLKKPKANGLTTIGGALINLIVHVSLIKFIGLYAAAASTLVSNIMLCFLRKYYLRNSIKCKIDGNTLLFILIFIYMLIISYLNVNYIVRILNIMLAVYIFVIINKKMIKKFLFKLRKDKYFGKKEKNTLD